MLADLRLALRRLAAAPSFSVPAVLSLALGIAANTTIFSVVDALLLRPLGGADAAGLIRIGQSVRHDGSFRAVSHVEYVYLRDHASTLDGLIGHEPQPMTLGSADGPQVVWGEIVTGNYFSVLGVRPPLGRGFAPDEDRTPGERPVLVLSDGLWRRRFGSDPAIVGRTVTLNAHRFTIVGVAPAGFRGTFTGFDIDLWVPVMMHDVAAPGSGRIAQAADRFLLLIARLTPGVSLARARADLQALGSQLAQAYPAENRDRTFEVGSAAGVHPFIATLVRAFLALLTGVVALVLVSACANVATLLLARAAARRRELATRLAIGAGRARLIGQLLVESLVLALAGGASGLLMAVGSIRVLDAFHPPTGVPIALGLHVDARVAIFTFVLATATAVVFGLAPALQATRIDIVAGLKDEGRLSGGSKSRLRDALIVAQVALSIVLLVGAALLVRSLRNAASLDPGFEPDRVAVISFDPEMLGYDRAKVERFYARLLERARALPGAERAAYADFVPMGDRGDSIAIAIPGRAPEGREGAEVSYNRVSPVYFSTVKLPLVAGRDFTDGDREGAPGVAIVNQAMARRLWPGADALAQRLRVRGEALDRQVVAVARDTIVGGVGEDARPYLYLPALQRYRPSLTLHVRSALPAGTVLEALRSIVRELDRDVPAYDGRPMRESMAFSLVPVAVARNVLGLSGLIALVLAIGGLYGIVTYTVAERVKEIGIRVALGATRAHVFAAIVGSAVRLTAIGIAIGAAAALAGTRALKILMYGVSPTDAPTFLVVALLLTIVALAASYGAARRGLDVDPMVALRRE